MDPVRERIEEALLGLEVEVRQQPGASGYELAYPGAVAEFVYDCLRQAPAVISPKLADDPDADRELSLLAHVARAFDEMGDLAVARVMAYLSDRYPPE